MPEQKQIDEKQAERNEILKQLFKEEYSNYAEQSEELKEGKESMGEEESEIEAMKKQMFEIRTEISDCVNAHHSLLESVQESWKNPDKNLQQKLGDFFTRLRGFNPKTMPLSQGIDLLVTQFHQYASFIQGQEKELAGKLEIAQNYILNGSDMLIELVKKDKESLEKTAKAKEEYDDVLAALQVENLPVEKFAELQKLKVERENRYLEESRVLDVCNYEITLTKNTILALDVYSHNIKDNLIEARSMQDYINTTYETINVITQTLISNIQMAELELKGLELYKVTQSMINMTMILSAQIVDQVTKERPEIMNGEFVEEKTRTVLEAYHKAFEDHTGKAYAKNMVKALKTLEDAGIDTSELKLDLPEEKAPEENQ